MTMWNREECWIVKLEKNYTKGLVTLDILTHNIAIKRHFDKKTFRKKDNFVSNIFLYMWIEISKYGQLCVIDVYGNLEFVWKPIIDACGLKTFWNEEKKFGQKKYFYQNVFLS